MTVGHYLALDESMMPSMNTSMATCSCCARPPAPMMNRSQIWLAGASSTRPCARPLASLLDQALADGSYMVYTSDARMRLAERQYLYPDITVACGEQAGTMLCNPVVVIEVLSPTTEKRDRGARFKAYKALPSLQEYLLIGSEYRAIEVHRRDGNFWRQYHYREGDLVELKSLGVSFPFDEVYRRIHL